MSNVVISVPLLKTIQVGPVLPPWTNPGPIDPPTKQKHPAPFHVTLTQTSPASTAQEISGSSKRKKPKLEFAAKKRLLYTTLERSKRKKPKLLESMQRYIVLPARHPTLQQTNPAHCPRNERLDPILLSNKTKRRNQSFYLPFYIVTLLCYYNRLII